MGRHLLRYPMGRDQELPGRMDREREAGIWPGRSCKFRIDEPTRLAMCRGSIATTRTIFSKFRRVSRTGQSAVHPNNTRARSPQGRSAQTQFEWKRLLCSDVGTHERCKHWPAATGVASTWSGSRRAGGLVTTRETWTGGVLARSGEEPSIDMRLSGSSTCVAHSEVPALTRYLRLLAFSFTKNERFCL